MLKKFIRSGLRNLGYDVIRRTTSTNYYLQLVQSMRCFAVDMVFDVGANSGQFGSELRSAGYDGDLVSFEPSSGAYDLLRVRSAGDARWHLHERSAVGDSDGIVDLNIAGNSVSSSVLPMLDTHLKAAVESAYVASETVPMIKLDTVAPHYLQGVERPLLKIDVQGFEWQVFDGAREVLPRIAGIVCELSLVPLYEGQHLWSEVLTRLQDHGFTLWSLRQGFTDLRNGRTLQADGTFFRL